MADRRNGHTGTRPAGGAPAVEPAIERDAEGRFPPRVVVGSHQLQQNGSGLCEWGFLGIDLYHGALYAERPVRSLAAALADEQLLVFHLDFVRSLSASQLREAFGASVEVNTGERLPEFQPALQQLQKAMATVQSGDSYTFVLEPRVGIHVWRNDVLVTAIHDEPFRRLFVQLYLGDQPPTQALRRGLLGPQ